MKKNFTLYERASGMFRPSHYFGDPKLHETDELVSMEGHFETNETRLAAAVLNPVGAHSHTAGLMAQGGGSVVARNGAWWWPRWSTAIATLPTTTAVATATVMGWRPANSCAWSAAVSRVEQPARVSRERAAAARMSRRRKDMAGHLV